MALLLTGIGGYVSWRTLVNYSAVNAAYLPINEPKFFLAVDAYENWQGILTYRHIARSLVAGKTDDIEKITALNTWAHNHVRSIYTKFPAGVIDDNFYNILRRGHGYCDQIAHVFATLGYFAGYKTRLYMLHNPEKNISPHTLAQVWYDNDWRFVEPYLGIVPLTADRRLVSLAALQRNPDLLIKYYAESGVPLSITDFPQGKPFYTFPYIGFNGFLKKLFSRRWITYSVPPPSSAPVVETKEVPASQKALKDLTILYDRARRLHLDGDFSRAQSSYAHVAHAESARRSAGGRPVFSALAYYEQGSLTEAVRRWNDLAATHPASLWAPSARYFLGECYFKMGDVAKARAHFQSANTPLARLRYWSLTQRSASQNLSSGRYNL